MLQKLLQLLQRLLFIDHIPLMQFNSRACSCDSENQFFHTHTLCSLGLRKENILARIADETVDLQPYPQQTVMSFLLYSGDYLIVMGQIVLSPQSVVTAVGDRTLGFSVFLRKPRCRTYHVRSVSAGRKTKAKELKKIPFAMSECAEMWKLCF